MAMLQHGTGNGRNGGGAVADSMAARSRNSRKPAGKPISKGPTPSKADPKFSNQDLINIVMNGLQNLQERYGAVIFSVPATSETEPALLVLPLKLDACPVCGQIFERSGKPHCDASNPSSTPGRPA